MPKSTQLKTPISGLFAVNKPSKKVTMKLLEELNGLLSTSPLFKDPQAESNGKRGRRKWKASRIKLGQGGTLDPLASGVLVIGVNDGTKKLSKFLDCTKEYRTVSLLGCATDSYDSEGKVVRWTPSSQITRQDIEKILDRFRGEIDQVPPIYSALKMDGKPLYEYARSNTPLPRPIEARKCTVYKLELTDFQPANSEYQFPSETVSDLAEVEKMEELVRQSYSEENKNLPIASSSKLSQPESTIPATFTLEMEVSSGTYVRSIVHDIGVALGSAAHVGLLERTRQGGYALHPEEVDSPDPINGCLEWSVFESAIQKSQEGKGEELSKWEEALLAKIDVV